MCGMVVGILIVVLGGEFIWDMDLDTVAVAVMAAETALS